MKTIRSLVGVVAFLSLGLGLAVGAAGCSDDDDDDGATIDGGPTADAPPPIDAGPPADAGVVAGEIRVIEGTGRSSAYGRIDARLFQGREPGFHEETMTSGDCRLLEFAPAFCESFCNGICVPPGTCEPYPTYLSAGTLTVTGVKGGSVVMQYQESIGYQPPDTVPEDLFDADDELGASAAGAGTLAPFQIASPAVAPLVAVITDFVITLAAGQDHVVSWTPAGDAGARVRLTINSPNRAHGQPFEAILECDAADAAGQVTIPAAMIDALPEITDARICVLVDCPRSSLRRYRAAPAPAPANGVRLVVGSELELGVEHRAEAP